MLPSVRTISRFLWVLTLIIVFQHAISARADWQSDWDQVKRAAAEEGEVVMYGPHLPFFNRVWEPFQSSYSTI